jgi:hypothetical protein
LEPQDEELQRTEAALLDFIYVSLRHRFEVPVLHSVVEWIVGEVLEIPPASSCVATGVADHFRGA